jgi:hypothetical protein
MMHYAIFLKVAVFLQKQIVDGRHVVVLQHLYHVSGWHMLTGASKRNSLVSPLKNKLHHTDAHSSLTASWSGMYGFLMVHYTFVSGDSSIKVKSCFIISNSKIRRRVSPDMQKPLAKYHWTVLGLSLFIAQSSLGS